MIKKFIVKDFKYSNEKTNMIGEVTVCCKLGKLKLEVFREEGTIKAFRKNKDTKKPLEEEIQIVNTYGADEITEAVRKYIDETNMEEVIEAILLKAQETTELLEKEYFKLPPKYRELIKENYPSYNVRENIYELQENLHYLYRKSNSMVKELREEEEQN